MQRRRRTGTWTDHCASARPWSGRWSRPIWRAPWVAGACACSHCSWCRAGPPCQRWASWWASRTRTTRPSCTSPACWRSRRCRDRWRTCGSACATCRRPCCQRWPRTWPACPRPSGNWARAEATHLSGWAPTEMGSCYLKTIKLLNIIIIILFSES